MEKQPTIIPEEMHLFKVDVVKSNINSEAFKNKLNHTLGIGHKMMHNLKDERVKLELAFSFEDDNKVQLANFQIDFHFKVEKLENFYSINAENKPVFSGLLIATLLGICVSTSRGIIFEKCNNNGIENLLIPIVSPQKMLVKK
jgi:hypothetical protein